MGEIYKKSFKRVSYFGPAETYLAVIPRSTIYIFQLLLLLLLFMLLLLLLHLCTPSFHEASSSYSSSSSSTLCSSYVHRHFMQPPPHPSIHTLHHPSLLTLLLFYSFSHYCGFAPFPFMLLGSAAPLVHTSSALTLRSPAYL